MRTMKTTPRPIRFIERWIRVLESRGWEVTVQRTDTRYIVSANGHHYGDFIAMSAWMNGFSDRWNLGTVYVGNREYKTYATAGAAIDTYARYNGRSEVTA